MTAFKAFANESQSLTIGKMTIENRLDKVSIYGDLDITKDKAGLAQALAVKAVIDSAVTALQAQNNLPENLPEPTVTMVDNPFA